MRARTLAVAAAAACAIALVGAGSAAAAQKRVLQGPLGAFTQPKGLAVGSSGDVYVIDGRSEVQRITVAASGGQFKLRFGGKETEDLAFNVKENEVRKELREIVCGGAACLIAVGGPGGANPFVVTFRESLASTDVGQIECVNGTTPLSGGSGCTVETTTNGVNGTITRYHANGTPADFAALGTNKIDARKGAGGKACGEEAASCDVPSAPGPEGLAFFSPNANLSQVAVDPVSGNIYVAEFFSTRPIYIFSSEGKYLGALSEYEETPGNAGTLKALSDPCGVAVAGSGEVYVGDLSSGIHVYDPSGDPVTNTDNVANFTTVAGPCTLAVGAGASAGFLFADRTVAENPMFKLKAETGALQYGGNPIAKGNLAIAVDSSSGQVVVGAGSGSTFGTEVREYDASGLSSATLLNAFAPPSQVSGVAVNGASGDLYLSRAGATQLDVYGPVVTLPDVTTTAASEVGGTTATLHGTISAAGGAPAGCSFQYTTEEAFQADKKIPEHDGFTGAPSAPCESGPFSGNTVNPVSAEVSGLAAETEYEFRIVGENEHTLRPGDDPGQALPFETLGKPRIEEPTTVSDVGATAATIEGAVDPRGIDASAVVQYVTQAQFEASGFAEAQTAPSPSLPVPAVVTGTGDLSAGTATVNLTAGSGQVLLISVDSGGLEVGQTISGPGITAGTKILTLSPIFLTISKPATASGTEVTISAASERVKNLTTLAGRFGPGEAIKGPGIPAGTEVVQANPLELVLSKLASEEVTGAALSASGPEPLDQRLSGLSPETTYFFRILAENEAGASEGKEGSFTTFAALGPGLPDGRAYELVSPAQKLGEVFAPEPAPRVGQGGSCLLCSPGWEKQRMPMQASPDGEEVVYEGFPFAPGEAAGANEYLARRGAGGWATSGLSGPAFADTAGQGFKAFSADLSRAVLLQIEPPLAAGAPAGFANLYLRESDGALQPLITEEPPQRTPGKFDPERFILTYAGANAGSGLSPAFSRVIFEANDALTGEVPGIAPAAPAVGAGETDLYEWSGGELHLINVLEGNGEAAPDATIGSGALLKQSGSENFDFDHAISADGRRVFWSALPSGQVYVREEGTRTIEIPDPGRFLTAAADGSRVLLSDGQLYDIGDEVLTDLSAGKGGFKGILGTSEDLSRVYFVDTEVLAGGAEEGKPNLYLWEEGEVPHEGTTALIATLAAADNEGGNVGELGTWKPAPGDRLAQASADGRYLAFESTARLTPYDNQHTFQVFEYDAKSGRLSCASCNPSGQRPLGPSNLTLLQGIGEAFEQLRNLPSGGEGALFFESQDTLMQADRNGHIQDVYEWKPGGVGGCAREGGCVALISSGQSPKDSYFLNTTPSGHDVFFITRSQLVGADKDDLLDVYDARVGGGILEGGSAPCSGEACAGPIPPPPSFEAPASSGGGSEEALQPKPRRCRAGFVRRGARCVRKHKAAHHRAHQAPAGGRR